jgi:hypothetical protein
MQIMDELTVYELVDVSDDEMYLPIGIFSSLENAIAAVESWGDNPEPELENGIEEYQKVEIRERKLDSFDAFREVWTREWAWDFENDKGRWSVINAKDEIKFTQECPVCGHDVLHFENRLWRCDRCDHSW